MARPRLIERDQIAVAALHILDEHGVDALSIERIAKELGVTGPALYNHFKDKDEILREVSRLVLGGGLNVPPDQAPTDFVEWIVAVSMLFFRRASEHPKAALVLLSHLPKDLSEPGFAKSADLMTAAGVSPRAQYLIMEGTQRLVWGWILKVSDVFAIRERYVARRRNERLATARSAAMDTPDMVEQSVRALIAGILERTGELERCPPARRSRRKS